MYNIYPSEVTDKNLSVNVDEEETRSLQVNQRETNASPADTNTTENSGSLTSSENELKIVDLNRVAELVAEIVMIKYRRDQHGTAKGEIFPEAEVSEDDSITKRESRG